VSVGRYWNVVFKGEQKYSEKTYNFVHRKSHGDWPGTVPRSPRWEAGD